MKKYRPNVGIVVFNRDKKVLSCRRFDVSAKRSWQFPQGGIEEGESCVDAGLRELQEETSIISVSVVAEMKEPLYYDFPPQLLLQNAERYHNYVGQKQNWILCYFHGEDTEINLQVAEPEFSEFAWVDISSTIDTVWEIKKHIYAKVCEAFSPIIQNYTSIR